MPLYEYQCDSCARRFERIQKFSDPAVGTCPACGGQAQRLISSPAIQFKGSGFYITDYAKPGQSPKETGSDASAAKEAASPEKTGAEKPAAEKPAASADKGTASPESKPASKAKTPATTQDPS